MKFVESLCRIALVTFVSLIWLAMAFLPTLARATGTQPTSSVTQASGGTVAIDQNIRTYGAGSTGLTSTAECLGSHSVVFNFVSSTYIERGCVIRHYAKNCKDAACRHALMCLDPDLLPEAKTVLGCKITP